MAQVYRDGASDGRAGPSRSPDQYQCQDQNQDERTYPKGGDLDDDETAGRRKDSPKKELNHADSSGSGRMHDPPLDAPENDRKVIVSDGESRIVLSDSTFLTLFS